MKNSWEQMTPLEFILIIAITLAIVEAITYLPRIFKPKKMENKDKWTFYRDQSGEWRWKRQAGNNEIIGASSEGFTSKFNCSYNAKRNGYYGEDEIDWVDETGLKPGE